jgi:hypothetical protein
LLGFGPVGENKGSTAGGDEEKGARGEGEKGKCRYNITGINLQKLKGIFLEHVHIIYVY